MKKHIFVIIALLVASYHISCSDSERRLPAFIKNTATVTIKLNLSDGQASAASSIIDRVFRFFMRDAVAQTAPAAFSSIRVVVTASDMTTIDRTFAPTDTMTITVPAGLLRRFEVTATVDPSSPSAALSFRGLTILPLTPGETIDLPVIMNLHETKIVIPDPFDNITGTNQRIIQINDMTGSGWIEKKASDIGFTGTFNPWSIDFDNRGRIYIANNNGTGDAACVIRINNMSDTAHVKIGDGVNSGVLSVAVDRTLNLVYYCTGSNMLRRCTLDGTLDTPLTPPPSLTSINGLAVGSNGMLYIAGVSSGVGIIYEYNPLTQTEIASYTGTTIPLAVPEDIEVRSPYIYITDSGDNPSNKIVRLDENLSNPVGYGTWLNPPSAKTASGQFWDPRRFVGIRNDGLIIIDDSNYTNNTDLGELVSIQDIYGTGWTRYGSDGKGTGQFQFFYGC